MAVFFGLSVWIQGGFSADPGERTTRDQAGTRGSSVAREAWALCLSPQVLPILVAFLGLELILMPLVYYWQPWFQRIAAEHAPVTLGFVFAVFQAAIIGASLFLARLSRVKDLGSSAIWLGLLTAYSVSMAMIPITQTFGAALGAFVLAEVFLTLGESTLKAVLNRRLASLSRATALSLVSAVARIGGFLSLAVCSRVLAGEADVGVGLSRLFTWTGVTGVAMWAGLGLWMLIKRIGELKTPAAGHPLCIAKRT